MITRAQMRRQLRAKGGIMNVAPREKFGLGSKIKERIRKLIPNEIANIAVKAAPFVAPFNPAIAGIMRGVGRFDQRGSISDALKQGLGTYAGGQAARMLGGGETQLGFRGADKKLFTSPLNQERTQAIKGLFQGGEKTNKKVIEDLDKVPTKPRKGLEVVQKGVDFVKDKVPILENLPDDVAQKLLVGSVTAGASALYGYFSGEFEPQQPGESMEEYMARRNTRVKQQMRGYMDSYYTPLRNPQYAAMSDEEKNNYIDSIVGQGMATGGRVGYQTGGISMSNTLARNIAANRAQAMANQGVLQAARKNIPQRTAVQEYAMSDDSILGPLSKQAASTIMEDQDKSQAALDVLNQTMTPTTNTGIMTQAPTISTPTPSVEKPTMADVAGPDTSNNLLSLFERYKDIQTPVGADPNNPDFVGETALGNIEKGVKGFLTSDRGLKYGKDIPSDIDDIYSFIEAQRRSFSPDLSQNYQGGDLYNYLQDFYTYKYGDPRIELPSGNYGYYDEQGPDGPVSNERENIFKSYFNKPYKFGLASGGRVGFSEGSNLKIKLKQIGYEDTLLDTMSIKELRELLDSEKGTFTDQGTYREPANMGGIMGMPMGEPRVNKGGITELDYRAKGGFVPVGIKEKADDVPAMLSKNEFVFTADAVRGAGNGSVEKGAQKMYDTMKNLERRVT